MINQKSNDVIIRMNMEPAVVRFNGQDINVLRPSARGFCFVEFDDGDAYPISHPLEEWIMSIYNSGPTPGTSSVGTIYFVINPPGERSSDGQDDRTASVTNIQTSL